MEEGGGGVQGDMRAEESTKLSKYEYSIGKLFTSNATNNAETLNPSPLPLVLLLEKFAFPAIFAFLTLKVRCYKTL